MRDTTHAHNAILDTQTCGASTRGLVNMLGEVMSIHYHNRLVISTQTNRSFDCYMMYHWEVQVFLNWADMCVGCVLTNLHPVMDTRVRVS